MMVDFESTHHRIRIGAAGDRKLNGPVTIEWRWGRLVPEVSMSIPMEARSGPIRSRVLCSSGRMMSRLCTKRKRSGRIDAAGGNIGIR